MSPRECVRVDRSDLEWWWDRAEELEWTTARTYQSFAPHSYVVADQTPGLTWDETVRAARAIVTYGSTGKYWSTTRVYLPSRDGSMRYWTCDPMASETNLVNRAPSKDVYGKQDARSTEAPPSPYDEVASGWDDSVDYSYELGELDRLGWEHFPGDPPTLLDVGAGTGRIAWNSSISAGLVTAVDPSKGMLNWNLQRFFDKAGPTPVPKRWADVTDEDLPFRTYRMVGAFMGAADLLTAEELGSMRERVQPGGLMVLMTSDSASADHRKYVESLGDDTVTMGRFRTTTWHRR